MKEDFHLFTLIENTVARYLMLTITTVKVCIGSSSD